MLTLLLTVFSTLALTSSSSDTPIPQKYAIAYTPISSSNSKPIACGVLLGTPITHPSGTQPNAAVTRIVWSLESWTAPRKSGTEERARLGLLDGAGKAFNGSTTLASMLALQQPGPLEAELYLQLDEDGMPASVALRGTKLDSQSSGDAGQPRLLVMTAAPEAKPVLNRPVVLNAEGKVDEPVQEKTLLQK